MIPAEFADWVYDFIHLLQGHTVHLLIELIEVCLYLLIIVGIMFVVALVEHVQDRLTIPEIRWMLCNIGFQSIKISFQGNTSQKFWVMLPWKMGNYK